MKESLDFLFKTFIFFLVFYNYPENDFIKNFILGCAPVLVYEFVKFIYRGLRND